MVQILAHPPGQAAFVCTGGLLCHLPHSRRTRVLSREPPPPSPPSPPGLSRTGSLKLKVLSQRSKRKSHKFKWGPDDLFGDDGPLRPPPSPGRKMMGQPSPESLDDTSVSCNVWDESAALPGEPSTTRTGMAAYVPVFFCFFLSIASARAPRTDQRTNTPKNAIMCGVFSLSFSPALAAAAIGFFTAFPFDFFSLPHPPG